MTATIIAFPVPISRQRVIRESRIIQYIMERHVDDNAILVGIACNTVRNALASDMSAWEAIELAERVFQRKQIL